MSDPLAFVPFALAAKSGILNGLNAGQLVAAGITMLQRSAPLVRALAGRPSALLLPPGPALLVALAASDGRAALVIDPDISAVRLQDLLARTNVGAVFTLHAFASRIPVGTTFVELDDVPRHANIVSPSRTHTVDLGSHHGLELTGSRDAEGADDVWLSAFDAHHVLQQRTHRDVLHAVRTISDGASLTPLDHTAIVAPLTTLDAVVAAFIAPLYMGGRITVIDAFDATTPWSNFVASIHATRVVATMAMLEQIDHLALSNTIRVAYASDAQPTEARCAAFLARTGIVLQALL